MRELTACPSCDATERTLVAEFNGLIALPETRHEDYTRYNYMLCHHCGLVYASRRPEGEVWQHLMRNFSEYLGRENRERVFNHAEKPSAEHVDRMLRLMPAFHEVGNVIEATRGSADPDDKSRSIVAKEMRGDIGSSYPVLDALARHQRRELRGARVLEVRAYGGFISHWLRNVYQVREACVMTHLPLQTEILRRAFGLNAVECLDFENFSIPFEGDFDVVVSNHMLIHAMDPKAFFATLRSRMREGGMVVLYNEIDDAAVYAKNRNLFGELRCFHFQQYDIPTFDRVLREQGLRPVFIRHVSPERKKAVLIAVATKDTSTRKPKPIPAADLEARRAMYEIWRSLSIAQLPSFISGVFPSEAIDQEARRLEASGLDKDRRGKVRKMSFLNEEGYEAAA